MEKKTQNMEKCENNEALKEAINYQQHKAK